MVQNLMTILFHASGNGSSDVFPDFSLGFKQLAVFTLKIKA